MDDMDDVLFHYHATHILFCLIWKIASRGGAGRGRGGEGGG